MIVKIPTDRPSFWRKYTPGPGTRSDDSVRSWIVGSRGYPRPIRVSVAMDGRHGARAAPGGTSLAATGCSQPAYWAATAQRGGTGLFASQATVCKLRDERTLETVSERFGLIDDKT